MVCARASVGEVSGMPDAEGREEARSEHVNSEEIFSACNGSRDSEGEAGEGEREGYAMWGVACA